MESSLHKKIAIKIEKEKKVVKLMIKIYCKGHKHSGRPCQSCSELIEYVDQRIERCPLMETKTYCNNCKIHCYKPDMKIKIKEVMRYSGPRMLFSHPIMVIDHVYQEIKHKSKNKVNESKKEEKRNDK